MLVELIARYKDAQKIWQAQFDEDDKSASASHTWRIYMDLAREIIGFRCSTIRQVQQKAKFILTEENLVDMLANRSSEVAVTDFLKSIAGTPVENRPVNNADNGEKRP